LFAGCLQDNRKGKKRMPELPDIAVYIEALEARLLGHKLERVVVASPFLLRTVTPSLREAEGRVVAGFKRLGKRIAVELDDDLWLVLHLMIAGRLHWNRKAGKPQASFHFSSGVLHLTEAGKEHRASLHVIRGEHGLRELDPGGLEPLECSAEAFAAALRRENHTLKRALTEPRLFSGIGNAYSDEILHRAKLSPAALTQKLSDDEVMRLHRNVQEVLREWIDRLRAECGGEFPEKITAFREEMAVHGKYKHPCPACGTKVERIRYASNETDYCPRCQTGGRRLADRALSRLLGSDWPRSIDE
jgi:formamidopyrimidine-DNA glycosylase